MEKIKIDNTIRATQWKPLIDLTLKVNEIIDFINNDCMVMTDNNPNHTKSASVSLMIKLICDKLNIDMEKLFNNNG